MNDWVRIIVLCLFLAVTAFLVGRYIAIDNSCCVRLSYCENDLFSYTARDLNGDLRLDSWRDLELDLVSGFVSPNGSIMLETEKK